MDEINLTERLQFDGIDLTRPDMVIKEIADQLEVQTKGIIKGIIEPYDNPIFSHRKPGFVERLSISSEAVQGKNVDIQDNLGKVGEQFHKFEFYLCTPKYNSYKYRVCFFQYGIGYYPTVLVVDSSIAQEVGYGSKYIFDCNNPSEIKELFLSIFNTKKITQVMQELINIFQIYKDADQPSQELQIDNVDNNDDNNN